MEKLSWIGHLAYLMQTPRPDPAQPV
jgi:hypothetical protein